MPLNRINKFLSHNRKNSKFDERDQHLNVRPVSKTILLELWNTEYPEKIKHTSLAEFELYLTDLQQLSHFLLLDDLANILGWAFSFERNNENWFVIILSEKAKNKGYGTRLLKRLKEKHAILNGWVIDHNKDIKVDGSPYLSPLNFYKKNNFSVIPSVRIETGKISAVKIQWKNEII